MSDERLAMSDERPAMNDERPAVNDERPVQGGMAAAIADQFSIQATIGGPLGLVEAVLPMTLFSLLYGLGMNMVVSVGAALASSLAFTAWRLIVRQPVTQALSGVFGIALGAMIAWRTGRAADFMLPILWKNAAYAAVYAVSIVLRWPLVGVLLGFMFGEGLAWRQVPARARAYSWATWAWAAMFAFRLAVQYPLWQMGAAGTLALVNVLLGLPLFAAVVWLTWQIVHRVPLAVAPPEPNAEAG